MPFSLAGGKAVQQLKQESGEGLFAGGVKLPLALTELGLIDEYEFVVHPKETLAVVERNMAESAEIVTTPTYVWSRVLGPGPPA